MITITLINKIRKHRTIYASFFDAYPSKIIVSVPAYQLLQSKTDPGLHYNFEVTKDVEIGAIRIFGMLVIGERKLSKYDFIFK